ncbi:hypothetical protein Q2T41_19390 [Maribacter confluentis]|uniref:Uncharacterized protein n=1 Tax=Maribacter confluentis TaxID=1656093 RepID=A0ABT8RWU6_9FLAO|nr:hypothetical protein [Maribacter confluentis]MDO1514814.1 hypothetical protein [Maribacter confluentis]
MKKYLLIGCLFLLFACDDGDLQIETVDFDSIDNVQNCGTLSTSSTNVVFKINGDESLIITLASGLLKNEVTTTDRESAVPGNSQVSYRIFSETVTSAYFVMHHHHLHQRSLKKLRLKAALLPLVLQRRIA